MGLWSGVKAEKERIIVKRGKERTRRKGVSPLSDTIFPGGANCPAEFALIIITFIKARGTGFYGRVRFGRIKADL
jgi:hypothetical protein